MGADVDRMARDQPWESREVEGCSLRITGLVPAMSYMVRRPRGE